MTTAIINPIPSDLVGQATQAAEAPRTGLVVLTDAEVKELEAADLSSLFEDVPA